MSKKNKNKKKIKDKLKGKKRKISSQNLMLYMLLFLIIGWFIIFLSSSKNVYYKEDIVKDVELGDIEIEDDLNLNNESDSQITHDQEDYLNDDVDKNNDLNDDLYEYGDIKEDDIDNELSTLEEKLNDNVAEKEPLDDIVTIHFIDVGQGDAALIEGVDGEVALIDGGPRSSKNILKEYLDNQGISYIDYIIATHPHEDHIGGLEYIIDNFDVDSIYMPNITHTTKTFENLLKAIDRNDVNLKLAEDSGVVSSYNYFKNTIIYPIYNTDKVFKDKSNLNLYSIVNKIEYGDISFMFTGDAEVPVENYLSHQFKDELSSTILKVGHHGSNTSSSEMFLDYVSPKVAIISSGVNNKYSHPHKEVLDRLADRDIEVYNTQEHGNIIIKTDGLNYEINTSKK